MQVEWRETSSLIPYARNARTHSDDQVQQVAASIKVMPNSPDIDLDGLQEQLEQALPEGARINGFEREDVAFGLIALFPTVLIPDEAGGTDAVEDAFAGVDGVESVAVDEVGRI